MTDSTKALPMNATSEDIDRHIDNDRHDLGKRVPSGYFASKQADFQIAHAKRAMKQSRGLVG